MKYTTIDDIENYLLINIETSFEPQVVKWVEQVEKYIDRFTGKNFKADTVVSARLYDGNGERSLLIDDCVAITKLEIDDVEVPSTDYFVYPANDERKNKIVLDGELFPEDHQNVKVTAKWGYSVAVPDDIAFVAMVLTAGIINFSNSSEGEVRSEAIGNYSVTYKDDKQMQDFDRAQEILKSNKKVFF